jgi:hypothetical protein
MCCSSGKGLNAKCAATGKQIKNLRLIKTASACQHAEKRFFDTVTGGACLRATWCNQTHSPRFTRNNPHA